MLRTLRRRLILSHIVPLLVVLPLAGILLIYTLETRVLLPSLSRELLGQAALVEEMTHYAPEVWTDRSQASAFIDRLTTRVRARVMLFDPNGRIVASSEAADASRIGQTLANPGLEQALGGQPSTRTAQSGSLQAEIADVFLPSVGADGRLVGAVRLSYTLTTELQQFRLLRYLVLGILVAGLIVGAVVGFVVALDTERPLQQATNAIDRLARGQTGLPVPETGPEEIRVLARSFNVLTARLHSLEASRRMLLANLVHELRRPLGALLSAVQALARGADADPALRQELLDGMVKQIHRLQRLVEDLAHLRQQVVGPLELHFQPIELSQWLPATLGAWRQAAAEKGLSWKAEIPAGLPTVSADPDRLAQIIDNLVANAIKYTPARGAVAVTAGADAVSFWIQVSDTGPGVAPEEQERIFTPFYRGAAASRFPQGMGLGLSIARDLATAHAGQILLNSTPGSGSRFTARLPRRHPVGGGSAT
jgi:two-component system sensor histidine kinase BaeS